MQREREKKGIVIGASFDGLSVEDGGKQRTWRKPFVASFITRGKPDFERDARELFDFLFTHVPDGTMIAFIQQLKKLTHGETLVVPTRVKFLEKPSSNVRKRVKDKRLKKDTVSGVDAQTDLFK